MAEANPLQHLNTSDEFDNGGLTGAHSPAIEPSQLQDEQRVLQRANARLFQEPPPDAARLASLEAAARAGVNLLARFLSRKRQVGARQIGTRRELLRIGASPTEGAT